MKVHRNIEQNSADWLILRSGKITASNADALVTATGKVSTGDGVKTFLMKVLAEAWIGGPLPALQGIFDMEQGKMLEESAKPAFTLHTGIAIENVAFVEADDGRAGCSPDAGILDGEKLVGAVEIKCPRMETHIRYLLDGTLPKDYVQQVQFSMFVTGLSKWHFFSYRWSFPNFHIVVERDPVFQDAFTKAVGDFNRSFDSAWSRLLEINGGPPKSRGLAPAPKPYTINPENYSEKTGDITP